MPTSSMEEREVRVDYGTEFFIVVTVQCYKETSDHDALMLAKQKLFNRLKHEVTPLSMLGASLSIISSFNKNH